MKKKSAVRKLQDKAEKLWKERCYDRDGRECQVAKHYPELEFAHSPTLQVDHCFSRKCSELKYEVSNGTVVCSACNRAKHYQQKSIHRLIDTIVMDREGKALFNEMRITDMRKAAFSEYSKVWWLEERIKQLEGV